MKNTNLERLTEDFGDFVSQEELKLWASFGCDRAENYGEFVPPSVPPSEEIKTIWFIEVDEKYR